jgi:glycosyltransferase involved in cell wall biosynthesis
VRQKVVITWGVSSFFGWGVYGLNLALAWAADPEVGLACALPVNIADLAIDAVRLRALSGFLHDSAQLGRQLSPLAGGRGTVQTPMLTSLNARFETRKPMDVALTGVPTIGVTFFETAQLGSETLSNAAALPLIITGSTWNEQVLRAHGLTNVRNILQGVDPTLFHPGPRGDHLGDRFLVFSGGKLERRKGQDIVLAAFRKFVERRPDALLVACWHSPWPQLARTVDRSGLADPVTFTADGQLDAAGWAAANGIGPQNFLDAGLTPNALMPRLLRRMDVALFPNRCEGGTNLVAMECMACGVPVILSANSGHLDLIEDDNCFALTVQRELHESPDEAPFGDIPGWGESDVDEAVELLERAYRHRDEARRRGERGAAKLAGLSWSRTAAQVKDAVLGLCDAGSKPPG